MIMTAAPTSSVPPHVPPELVRSYPFRLGNVTTGDPFALVAEIHEGPPIFYCTDVFLGTEPSWIIRRVETLRAVYMDTEHFSNVSLNPFSTLTGEDWLLIPAQLDPPGHASYRSLVSPLFTPRSINALGAKVRLYAEDYIRGFLERGSCEFMSEFAFEFPIKVFLELMGLPLELTAQFLEWEMGLLHALDLDHMTEATRTVVAYLRGVIEERKKEPRDDFVTYGTKAEIEGRKLSDDELLGFCFNLFVGGLDTVSTHMGLQFRYLAEHPGDQAMLRGEADKIPSAVDELMRAYGAVTTFRTCVKETRLEGMTILPGDRVALATTLAGRDPEAFDRPGEVRFDRRPRHVSFGYGPHLCVGMYLARREMQIAMEQFLALVPPFSIEPGAVIRSQLGAMVLPETLPLTWGAA
jgi:cytochrome P450